MLHPGSCRRPPHALYLLAPLLLLRLLVPAGFMPGGPAAALGLKLCPGAQAGMAQAGHGLHHQHERHDSQQHVPCLFSAGATPAPLTAAAAAVPAHCSVALKPPAPLALRGVPSIDRAPSARAPPATRA